MSARLLRSNAKNTTSMYSPFDGKTPCLANHWPRGIQSIVPTLGRGSGRVLAIDRPSTLTFEQLKNISVGSTRAHINPALLQTDRYVFISITSKNGSPVRFHHPQPISRERREKGSRSYGDFHAKNVADDHLTNLPRVMVKFFGWLPLSRQELRLNNEAQWPSNRKTGKIVTKYEIVNPILLKPQTKGRRQFLGGILNSFDRQYTDPAMPVVTLQSREGFVQTRPTSWINAMPCFVSEHAMGHA